MADLKKLDSLAEKLLDIGKRNNLVSYRDSKLSSAEILFPSCENIFSKCVIGYTFRVFDPKIPDTETDETEKASGTVRFDNMTKDPKKIDTTICFEKQLLVRVYSN